MKYLFTLAMMMLCAGCISQRASGIALLHTDMTKAEVIHLLGQPWRITNRGGIDIYDYHFTTAATKRIRGGESGPQSYYVVIGRDDKVRSFGRN